MSRSVRNTFLIHAVVAIIFGAPLLIAPGRWLQLFDWSPIDPLMSRMFGSALLALAYGSYRGWRSAGWDQVAWLVRLEAVFTVLATIGLLRHLLVGSWPFIAWFTLAIFVIFAAAWISILIAQSRSR